MNAGSDWPAVAKAIEERMGELKVSTAALARRTKLAEGTIRGVRMGRVKPTGATLGMLAVGLGWPGDYLWRVAEGQRAAGPSPGTITTERLIRMERKLDALCGYMLPFSFRPEPGPDHDRS